MNLAALNLSDTRLFSIFLNSPGCKLHFSTEIYTRIRITLVFLFIFHEVPAILFSSVGHMVGVEVTCVHVAL